MDIRRSLFVCVVMFAASVAQSVTASEFNGEVLVAPSPPNWTGGTPLRTANGVRQVWRRIGGATTGTTEQITILRGLPGAESDPAARVRTWMNAFTKPCVSSETSTVSTARTEISRSAQASAICERKNGRVRHAKAMVLIGEFGGYRVVRSWSGPKDNPGNPRDSQKMATIWNDYFGRISLCNTLTDACDTATAAAIYAHPRFREMRMLETAERPVLPANQVQQGAKIFGNLTGQAEACGEDVSPLLLRIGRMFAHVSANDADASSAGRIFDMARADAVAPSGNNRAELCGEIRRQFRDHPSRVQGFARYIIGLI